LEVRLILLQMVFLMFTQMEGIVLIIKFLAVDGGLWGMSLDEWADNPQSGTTCMKWTYTAEGKQKQGYAGVIWQTPMGWYRPEEERRFDLSQAKRMTFWARGENGNEKIKVQVGIISEEFPDSAMKISEVLTLSKDWQKFTLDLSDADLSCISNIFCWMTDKQMNPQGCTFLSG